MRLLTALMVGCVALSLAGTASAVFAQQDAGAERARLQHNIQVATAAASTFDKQASEAGPSESSDQQKRVYAEQTEFLRRGASQISDLTEKARVAIRNAKPDAGQMAAMNMQFLAL